MGPLSGSCSPERFAVHDGRIYIFASDACRATFLKSPAQFIDADDPPLAGGDPAAAEQAQALLAKALAGLGGAERVDAVRALRIEERGVDDSDGKQHVTRDVRLWRLPDDLYHETAWDEWAYPYVVTAQDAFSGSKHSETLSPAARRELRKQLGREPLWLLRHRDDPGFSAAAADNDALRRPTSNVLKVHFEGATTTLWIDAVSGRIVRAAWRGRFGTGSIGQVVIDYSDFRETGGLLLPHAREVSFDGQRDESMSGPVESLEVDPVIGEELFARRP